MTMIATFNVNSINKRLPIVINWLMTHNPDVLILQELKCESKKFPFSSIENLGYQCSVVGQKKYNGIAILTLGSHQLRLDKLSNCARDIMCQARYLEISYLDQNQVSMIIVGIYLPNGNPVLDSMQQHHVNFVYKIRWMECLKARSEVLLQTEKIVVIAGDFNVIPHGIDCHDTLSWINDALYHPKVRQLFFKLCHSGYSDAWRILHPMQRQYSFWDYRQMNWQKNKGVRIDHILLSPHGLEYLVEANIDFKLRGKFNPSDHTPVWCRLNTKM